LYRIMSDAQRVLHTLYESPALSADARSAAYITRSQLFACTLVCLTDRMVAALQHEAFVMTAAEVTCDALAVDVDAWTRHMNVYDYAVDTDAASVWSAWVLAAVAACPAWTRWRETSRVRCTNGRVSVLHRDWGAPPGEEAAELPAAWHDTRNRVAVPCRGAHAPEVLHCMRMLPFTDMWPVFSLCMRLGYLLADSVSASCDSTPVKKPVSDTSVISLR
jgi:hypothetical protein